MCSSVPPYSAHPDKCDSARTEWSSINFHNIMGYSAEQTCRTMFTRQQIWRMRCVADRYFHAPIIAGSDSEPQDPVPNMPNPSPDDDPKRQRAPSSNTDPDDHHNDDDDDYDNNDFDDDDGEHQNHRRSSRRESNSSTSSSPFCTSCAVFGTLFVTTATMCVNIFY